MFFNESGLKKEKLRQPSNVVSFISSKTKDSVDKIIQTYFACVTKNSFVYKNKTYFPKPLRVSPLLFRGFTCPENCGACCSRLTLDYLSSEKHPRDLKERDVVFNGKHYTVFSDLQNESIDYHCKYLNKKDGRCAIHECSPFSADFELIRFLHSKTFNTLTQKLYGRGWAMLKFNKKERGALCKMTPTSEHIKKEIIRKFQRLKEWANYFELDTCIDEILEYVATGPHNKAVLNTSTKGLT